MEQIKTKIKQWGNSYGIIVPMEIIKKEDLKDNSEVTITIQPRRTMTGGDLMKLGRKYGVAKKLKNIDTAKALKEVDKLFWPEDE